MGGASELATVLTISATFLPCARMAWIFEISVCELPSESTISSGTLSFLESAFAPSIIEAMYGLVVLMTDATRTMSFLSIGCWLLAVVEEQAVVVSRPATSPNAAARRAMDLLRCIKDSFVKDDPMCREYIFSYCICMLMSVRCLTGACQGFAGQSFRRGLK